MKKLFFVAFVLTLSKPMLAQQATPGKAAMRGAVQDILRKQMATKATITPSPLAKTTATANRLIARSMKQSEQFMMDTVRFIYSGGRGSVSMNPGFHELPLFGRVLDDFIGEPLVSEQSHNVGYSRVADILFDTAYHWTLDSNVFMTADSRVRIYDSVDRMLTSDYYPSLAVGDTFLQRFEYQYNPNGSLSRMSTAFDLDINDTIPPDVVAINDVSYQNGLRVTDSCHNSPALHSNGFSDYPMYFKYAYDAQSRLIEIKAWYADYALSTAWQAGYILTLTYDNMDRVTKALVYDWGSNQYGWTDSFAYTGNSKYYSFHAEDAYGYWNHWIPSFNSYGLWDTLTIIHHAGLPTQDTNVRYAYFYNADSNITHAQCFHSFTAPPGNTSDVYYYYEQYTPSNFVTTSLGKQQTVAQGKLYPNPASQMLTLELPAASRHQHIIITNTLGQRLREYSYANQQQINIPIADLPAGQYFLTMVQDGGKESYSFVKQ